MTRTVVSDLLFGNSAAGGKSDFLVSPQARITYDAIRERASCLASTLLDRGFKSGDCVLFDLSPGPAFLTALFGTLRLGGVVVLGGSPEWRSPVIQALGKEYWWISGRAGGEAVRIRRFAGEHETEAGLLDEWAAGKGNDPIADGPGPEDPAVIIYTSGTEGQPRGVVKTHRQLMVEIDALDAIYRSDNPRRFLSVLSWDYIYGLIHHLLLPSALGAAIHHLGDYTPRVLLETIEKDKIDVFIGVPALYQLLARSEGPRRPIRATTSGAPLTPTAAAALHQRLGWKLTEFFGSTETGGISVNLEKHLAPENVGQPLPFVEVAIGATGAIRIRGPAVSRHCWLGPDRVRLTDPEGWYATGDLGGLDSEGRLTLQGRDSRIINFDGRRVSLDRIESVFDALPGVSSARANGENCALHGEIAVLQVVPKPGQKLDTDQLARAAEPLLARHERPKRIELIEAIEESLTHKLTPRRT